MMPLSLKIGLGFVAVVGIVFLIMFLTGTFDTKPSAAPATAPAPEAQEEELESTESDKCYVERDGQDVQIDCLPPSGQDHYTYATFKKGSGTERRKVPCVLTTPCIVPPTTEDVELKVKIRSADREGKEELIFKQLCEADYSCPTDPIYQKIDGVKNEVMRPAFRTNCHNENLIATCATTYFDTMRATTWRPNPDLSLSAEAKAVVGEFARAKVVEAPTEVIDPLTIPAMDLDRFAKQCELKGFEFAKNCKTECPVTRYSDNKCGSVTQRSGRSRERSSSQSQPGSSSHPAISGMPRVHDYTLSLRRLADSYTV
jgi:hypothetical protein